MNKIMVEISENLYNFVMNKRRNPYQSFEEVLESILKIYHIKPKSQKKIVFVGKPEVGKSSIRSCFFEFIQPKELITNSLEPTIGIENYIYDLYDLKCNIVDTSGQELEDLLMNRAEDIFIESNLVIFVVDSIKFKEDIKHHYELLKKIISIATMYSKNVVTALFVHKIDLISKNEIKQFKNAIMNEHRVFELAEEVDIPLFFTSIIEDYLDTIKIAFIKLIEIEEFLMPNYRKFLDLNL